MTTLEAERIAEGPFELGENPLWDDRRAVLFFTDIDAGQLYRYSDSDGLASIYRGPKVGGFTLQRDGSLLLFRVDDLALLDPDNEEPAKSILPFIDEGTERFNDVLACPDGSVLGGTIGRDEHSGGLFHVLPDGSHTNLWRGTRISNGMAFTDDLRSLFWTCSSSGRVFRARYDTDDGTVGSREPVFTVPEDDGTPDGMTLDTLGRVWQARWGARRAVCLDSEWNEVARVNVPVDNVSSVCFGGPDLATLYITTSGGGLFRAMPSATGRAEFRSNVVP